MLLGPSWNRKAYNKSMTADSGGKASIVIQKGNAPTNNPDKSTETQSHGASFAESDFITITYFISKLLIDLISHIK